MPFITQDRRKIIDEGGLSALETVEPGDRCYFFYKRMVERWKGNPRWTTAHNIYKDMCSKLSKIEYEEDDGEAYELAWQVFFQLYVMPYELRKREENGAI